MQQRTAGLIVSIALWCWLYPLHSNAQPSSSADTSGAATSGNGQHDFDFEEGRWNIHLKRLLHPLTGSTSWVEFDGTSVTRRVWDGKAWLEEFETRGATGKVEGLTLRLYHPDSRQWYLYWSNAKDGVLGLPTIGQFRNGVGEFLIKNRSMGGRSWFDMFGHELPPTRPISSSRSPTTVARPGK